MEVVAGDPTIMISWPSLMIPVEINMKQVNILILVKGGPWEKMKITPKSSPNPCGLKALHNFSTETICAVA